MTSEVIWSDIFTGVIEVIKHHMPISHSPCRRRYIGPLPSCSANETQWQMHIMHIMHIGVCMHKENIDIRVIIGYCDIII